MKRTTLISLALAVVGVFLLAVLVQNKGGKRNSDVTPKEAGIRLPATNQPIPEFIVNLLRNPRVPLNPEDITNRDPANVDIVIDAYRSTGELTNRRGLITALAFMGDERVIPVFLNTLTNEYAGQTLNEQQCDVMQLLASHFGVLARESDAALRFIVEQGSRPSFWSQYRNWARDADDQTVNKELAGICIQSLGWTQRSDLNRILEELKNRTEDGFNQRFSGDIVQAAFYDSVLRKYGSLSAAKPVLGDLQTSFEEFARWQKSPEGATWMEWSQNVKRSF